MTSRITIQKLGVNKNPHAQAFNCRVSFLPIPVEDTDMTVGDGPGEDTAVTTDCYEFNNTNIVWVLEMRDHPCIEHFLGHIVATYPYFCRNPHLMVDMRGVNQLTPRIKALFWKVSQMGVNVVLNVAPSYKIQNKDDNYSWIMSRYKYLSVAATKSYESILTATRLRFNYNTMDNIPPAEYRKMSLDIDSDDPEMQDMTQSWAGLSIGQRHRAAEKLNQIATQISEIDIDSDLDSGSDNDSMDDVDE
jgi:hypothetical protein